MKSWADLPFWTSKQFEDLKFFLSDKVYFPQKDNILKAFRLTPLKRVKCVIVGQDPYYNGEATGLAFSSNRLVKTIPASLQNIFKEYTADLKYPMPKSGNLTAWAKRGVLLINSALTVAPMKPGSHAKIGWSDLIKEALQAVQVVNPNAVFILWGQHAKDTVAHMRGIHRVMSPHPSPLSASQGFFGSRPFTKCNGLLLNNQSSPIDWRLP